MNGFPLSKMMYDFVFVPFFSRIQTGHDLTAIDTRVKRHHTFPLVIAPDRRDVITAECARE